MPELAEVEYVARQLRDHAIGATISAVTLAWPRAISHPSPEAFVTELVGRTITGIDRRGKLLLVALSGDGWLTVHRRMSGNLRLLTPDEPDEQYLVVDIRLADGRRLQYSDPRKFGRLAFWHADELPQALAQYGAEPLAADFTPARLAAILHGRARALKPLLLDQAHIAGLGNIYADEALHRAGLHPLRRADTLTPAEIARLRDAIVTVLELGIAHGGTTFGRHQGLFGEAGRNVAHLLVYQREGQPCVTCGTPIQRIVVAQRGTRFCPRCQPAPESTH
jgi:formamidopyrimidine-DNA glycosylase